MTPSPADPQATLDALKKYFGYSTFRPFQEETIRALLSGQDAFLLMPTGGGKSLCYQLPAVLSDGLTLVVSPLIALMKDQVDQLNALGIPATFLNSSLEPGEAEERIKGINAGRYKLLYVAPERLNTPGFLRLLTGISEKSKLSLIAIDEAHCISEWGHDFRIDYRDLSQLKKRWPTVPMIAMTATATKRVEEDIIAQLGLKNAHRAEASFNRPNLTYSVLPKQDHFGKLLQFLENRKYESGIVYCFSKDGTERLAATLRQQGLRALPYHAGLDATLRSKTHEKFSRDEVDIICATIAFGMGINKPNVRFVVHYDLPKHLAGYYQETGRAGRDGLAADCLLFYGYGDQVKLLHFIEQKESQAERAHAKAELARMVAFANTSKCRRAQLLSYFNESFTTIPCGGCDNCNRASRGLESKIPESKQTETSSATSKDVGGEPALDQPFDQHESLPHGPVTVLAREPITEYDATRETQMFLSCIARVNQKFGAIHIINILRGSENSKVMEFRHHNLSTYGIGKNYTTNEWRWLSSELLRLGYISQDVEHFGVLRVEPLGWAVLNKQARVMLESKPERVQTSQNSSTDKSLGITPTLAQLPKHNEELFQLLRALRKRIADHENLPPFVIFHDTTLRQMAALLPLDTPALLRVSGVGEAKAAKYGKEFLSQIRQYVQDNEGVAEVKLTLATLPREVSPVGTAALARPFILSGLSIEATARERNLSPNTIADHVTQLIAAGDEELFHAIIAPQRHQIILQAFEAIGWHALKPVLEHLQSASASDTPFSYAELRMVRAYEQLKQTTE